MLIDPATVKSWGMLEIAYNQKGIELAKANKIAKARILFRQALELNPNYAAAKTNLERLNIAKNSSDFHTIFSSKKAKS